MTIPGIYHTVEFAFLVKLVKLGWCFDYSVKFYNTLLNKVLLSDTDLTSQIVGVLTRFRSEKEAFMTYIEFNFHHLC